MGEIADIVLGDILELGDDCTDEETGVYYPPGHGRTVTCMYCKAYGFRWKQVGDGWRLADARGVIHSCDGYRKRDD